MGKTTRSLATPQSVRCSRRLLNLPPVSAPSLDKLPRRRTAAHFRGSVVKPKSLTTMRQQQAAKKPAKRPAVLNQRSGKSQTALIQSTGPTRRLQADGARPRTTSIPDVPSRPIVTAKDKGITTFAQMRQQVLYELQNLQRAKSIKWKRYPSLNKVLKGHRRGELTIVAGPPASGKTTFMSEYSLDLAMQGVCTLWASFGLPNNDLVRTMLQQMSGHPLDENMDLVEHYANQLERLPVYFLTLQGQQSIELVLDTVERAAHEHNIAHLIIDNMQFMIEQNYCGTTNNNREQQAKSSSNWLCQREVIIDAFHAFSRRRNCHVTVVINTRPDGGDDEDDASSIMGVTKTAQKADNVLIIQDQRLTSMKGKRYLQVAKNRFSGDLGVMTLDFDRMSLSFAKKARRNTTMDKRAKTLV